LSAEGGRSEDSKAQERLSIVSRSQIFPHTTIGKGKLGIPSDLRFDNPLTGGSVVKWVTIGESPLLYVFDLLLYVPYILVGKSALSFSAGGGRHDRNDAAQGKTRDEGEPHTPSVNATLSSHPLLNNYTHTQKLHSYYTAYPHYNPHPSYTSATYF
jgi:hypothetical protein